MVLYKNTSSFLLLFFSLFWLNHSSLSAKDTDTLAEVKNFIAQHASSKNGLGGALMISKGGKHWFSAAYGMADVEHRVQTTLNTVFEAGSVSKQFTAAGIILLITEKKLQLTDDIRKYIPELPDYGTPITVENILTHTSGVKDWWTVLTMSGWPRSTKVYTQNMVYDLIFRQKSLVFTPGTDFAYSNSNHNLMVLLIERITGQSFTDFTKERIFNKAGLKNSSWRTNFRDVVHDRAIAYRYDKDKLQMFMPFENTYGHAALLTTVSELIQWNNALKAEVFGREFEKLRLRQFTLPNGKKTEYACGALFIRKVNEHLEICHTGSTAGYRAWLTYYPEKDISVAYLSNNASVASIYMARKISDILIGGKRDFLAYNPTSVKTDKTNIQKKAGVYKHNSYPHYIELSLSGDSLYLKRDPEWNSMYNDPWKYHTRKFVLTNNTLKAETPHIDQVYHKIEQKNWQTLDLNRFVGNFSSKEIDARVSMVKKDDGLYLRFDHGGTVKLAVLSVGDNEIVFVTDENVFIEFDAKEIKASGFKAHLSQQDYILARADRLIFKKVETE